jgi:hypothetical protein
MRPFARSLVEEEAAALMKGDKFLCLLLRLLQLPYRLLHLTISRMIMIILNIGYQNYFGYYIDLILTVE